jgi:hypothetical protein
MSGRHLCKLSRAIYSDDLVWDGRKVCDCRIDSLHERHYVQIDGANNYARVWASAISMQAEKVDPVVRQENSILTRGEVENLTVGN